MPVSHHTALKSLHRHAASESSALTFIALCGMNPCKRTISTVKVDAGSYETEIKRWNS